MINLQMESFLYAGILILQKKKSPENTLFVKLGKDCDIYHIFIIICVGNTF